MYNKHVLIDSKGRRKGRIERRNRLPQIEEEKRTKFVYRNYECSSRRFQEINAGWKEKGMEKVVVVKMFGKYDEMGNV